MNAENIVGMAKEARLPYYYRTGGIPNIKELAAFANLVAAAEREACLKAVERAKVHQFILYPKGASIDANKVGEIYAHQHEECVKAIKARGEK